MQAKEENGQTLTNLFKVLYKPESRWSEQVIRQNIQKGKYEYWIIFDDEPVGVISLKFPDSTCEVEAIAVSDPWKGYGSKLIEFAEELAKKRGCETIWCHSLELYQAGKFYKKLGWLEEYFMPDYWDGQHCYKYSKSLASK